MGTFTSIIHPDDGRELQIKSGHDSCETYHVGDTVNWYINKSWPKSGKLLDDVYDSYNDDWVVIKDHIVAAVVSRDRNYNSIKEEYQVKDLPDSEWPEESWENKRIQEEESAKEWAEYEKSIAHLSGINRLAAIMSYPIRKRLKYESVTRKLFSVEPIIFDDIKDSNNDKTK